MIEKLYTVEEVAELASVTGRTIRNYLKSGRLVGRKIGGQWRFSEDQVQRLLNGSPEDPEMDGSAGGEYPAGDGPPAAAPDQAAYGAQQPPRQAEYQPAGAQGGTNAPPAQGGGALAASGTSLAQDGGGLAAPGTALTQESGGPSLTRPGGGAFPMADTASAGQPPQQPQAASYPAQTGQAGGSQEPLQAAIDGRGPVSAYPAAQPPLPQPAAGYASAGQAQSGQAALAGSAAAGYHSEASPSPTGGPQQAQPAASPSGYSGYEAQFPAPAAGYAGRESQPAASSASYTGRDAQPAGSPAGYAEYEAQPAASSTGYTGYEARPAYPQAAQPAAYSALQQPPQAGAAPSQPAPVPPPQAPYYTAAGTPTAAETAYPNARQPVAGYAPQAARPYGQLEPAASAHAQAGYLYGGAVPYAPWPAPGASAEAAQAWPQEGAYGPASGPAAGYGTAVDRGIDAGQPKLTTDAEPSYSAPTPLSLQYPPVYTAMQSASGAFRPEQPAEGSGLSGDLVHNSSRREISEIEREQKPSPEPSTENISEVGKKVLKFVEEVHDCSHGPHVCAVVDLHQSFGAAKITSERLTDIASQESEAGVLCHCYVEYDERYFVARYTLIGSSSYLLRCMKLIG